MVSSVKRAVLFAAAVAVVSIGPIGLIGLAGCHDLLGIDEVVPGGQADGSPEPDGGTDGPVSSACTGSIAPEEAWKCITTTLCDFARRCINDDTSDTDCEHATVPLFDRINPVIGDTLTRNAIAAGTLRYQPDALAPCLDRIKSLSCTEIAEANPLETCTFYNGTVADGKPCYFDLECQGLGAQCEPIDCGSQTCCLGVCRAPAPVGGDCQASNGVCVPGSYCANGVCTEGKLGDPCTGSPRECDEPFWCNDGRCDPDVPSGDPCFDNEQCPAPERCVSGTCARSSEVGDPCTGECTSRFTHFCKSDGKNPSGTCELRGKLGQPCIFGLDSCQMGLRCNSDGFCESLGLPGAPCQDVRDCRAELGQRFCDNDLTVPTVQPDSTSYALGLPLGSCKDPQPDGASCYEARHCASGSCFNAQCASFEGCHMQP